ncbi:MAG: enoyl-CoA hydratase/isomerase family protein, partial [Dehalococcoidia bacterium]|nr:enoyl-CoA hydratase/isomerase family protein [Dehalococcoidia bacterium]
MSPSTVIIQKNDHIARITLNRPADGNVINIELGQELEEACRQANQDDDVYVVVITGAGDTFCNGSELERSFNVSKRRPALEEMGTQYNVASAVAGIEKPVIAALNGDALGQGLEIALACDIRIASSAVELGFPNVKLGILPMDGGTQRLPRLIGKGKSLELIFLAETIDAEEAEQIGLVSRVVPPASLSAEVDALAKSMANKAPIALRYIKEAVNKGLDL